MRKPKNLAAKFLLPLPLLGCLITPTTHAGIPVIDGGNLTHADLQVIRDPLHRRGRHAPDRCRRAGGAGGRSG